MPILLSKTIRLFLDSIGKREEYQYYLERFQASRSAAFALICPERMGFEEAVEVLNFDLGFLARLELFPTLLLCGVGACEMRDLLMSGSCHYEEMDLSGRIINSQTLIDIEDFLNSCRQRHRIGVLLARGRTQEEILEDIIPAISKRVHFLRLRGPLHTVDGTPLMNYSYNRADRPELAVDDRPIADTAATLIERCPDLHLSITSPWNIMQELFTIKGAGCLVRRGSSIVRIDDQSELDYSKLARLMCLSFGRKIIERALHKSDLAFVEESYRGAALIERHDCGWYLSKFAVEKDARGEGLAAEIWSEVMAANPSLFWRARKSNPINHWYQRHADGFHGEGEWIVFWCNIDWKRIPEIISYSLDRSDDFES